MRCGQSIGPFPDGLTVLTGADQIPHQMQQPAGIFLMSRVLRTNGQDIRADTVEFFLRGFLHQIIHPHPERFDLFRQRCHCLSWFFRRHFAVIIGQRRRHSTCRRRTEHSRTPRFSSNRQR